MKYEFRATETKIQINSTDDEIPYTSPTNSAVLISPTSMISNSSAISVPSSQSAHLISPMNANNNNNQNHQMMNSSSQNGSLVSHSQSAHQLGHVTIPQQPVSHHQMLQQQLQKHFANNNMGEYRASLFFSFVCDAYYAICSSSRRKTLVKEIIACSSSFTFKSLRAAIFSKTYLSENPVTI